MVWVVHFLSSIPKSCSSECLKICPSYNWQMTKKKITFKKILYIPIQMKMQTNRMNWQNYPKVIWHKSNLQMTLKYVRIWIY